MNNFSNKVLVLFGSPHKDGNTAKILKYIINLLDGYDITTINAYERNIHPCIDCKVCKKVEKCAYNDMDDIDTMFRECNILIIASPIYNSSFPAPLKAIFDRTQRYYNAKVSLGLNPPIKKVKKALLLVTQGSKSYSYEKGVRGQINPLLGLLNVSENKYINVSGTDNENFDIDKFYMKSKNRIDNIINSLHSNL